MMQDGRLFLHRDGSVTTAPQPEPASFCDVPSQACEAGPTIAANRRPNPAQSFVPLDDARADARWSFWAGVFVGALGCGAFISLGALLS